MKRMTAGIGSPNMRKRLFVQEVQKNLYAVFSPKSETAIGYVVYSIIADKWWLYNLKSVKLDGHEYDSRSTAVRTLAKVLGHA
jgi:hypothetical protein